MNNKVDLKTLLRIFEKLSLQYKNMTEAKKKSMLQNKQTVFLADLAPRLNEIPNLQERIKILEFKDDFISESAEIQKFTEQVTKAAKDIMQNDKLRQLLQIMVQAINQGIQDFAKQEKQSIEKYKGVPAHGIWKFMKQDTVMKIVSDKVLRSSLNLQEIVIPSLESVKHVHIEDTILARWNNLNNKFQEILKFKNIPSLAEYINETSGHLKRIEKSVSNMNKDLISLSIYMGEQGNLSYTDSVTDKTYTILGLVEALLTKWHEITTKAAAKIRKEKTDRGQASTTNIIRKAIETVRNATNTKSDDDDGWESD